MKKNVLVLIGDYWHPSDTIKPLIELMFSNAEWDVKVTENPNELLGYNHAPHLFVSFKDASEDNRVPTPIWCDEKWSETLKKFIAEEGMGFLAVHCALADIPKEHVMTQEILRARFVSHPPQCEVKFTPEKAHPITNNVSEFTFPSADEHYIMEMTPNTVTEILGYTVSQHGSQPALWAHSLGKGRVCGVTPGHTTENLTYPEYVKLLKNAAEWCTGKI